MQKLIMSRLLQGAVVIFFATVAAFLIVRVIPSDPARLIAPQASEEQLKALRAELGFDQPIPAQLVDFLSNALRGDFGNSVYLHDPVSSLIAQKLPMTMVLVVLAISFALMISVPVGAMAAVKRDTVMDRLILVFSIGVLSTPNFWLGLILIELVAVRWGVLPAQGYYGWKNFVLPSFTLSLTLMPLYIRMTRAVMIDVLGQDFVKSLVARGVSRPRIIFRHALKNIAVPLITMLGVQFGQLLGGALVIELIFNFPGLGLLMFKGVLRRDYPLVQGITVTLATIFVVLNLLVDLSYIYLDPRIRRQEITK